MQPDKQINKILWQTTMEKNMKNVYISITESLH